mgnify:CR=1
MQHRFSKSIFQHQSWQGSGRQLGSLPVAFLLIVTIPLIAFLPAIWLLDAIRRKEQALELTQEELEESTQKL